MLPRKKEWKKTGFLKAKAPQKAALLAYFAAKTTWPPEWQTQIANEVNGISPFFYLKYDGTTYSLVDNFKYILLNPVSSPYPLTIDDDYPVGTYLYKGLLKSETNAPMQVNMTMLVYR